LVLLFLPHPPPAGDRVEKRVFLRSPCPLWNDYRVLIHAGCLDSITAVFTVSLLSISILLNGLDSLGGGLPVSDPVHGAGRV